MEVQIASLEISNQTSRGEGIGAWGDSKNFPLHRYSEIKEKTISFDASNDFPQSGLKFDSRSKNVLSSFY